MVEAATRRFQLPVCLLVAALAGGCGDPPTSARPGSLRVILARAGSGSDADGVVIQVTHMASGASRSIPATLGDTARVDSLAAGAYVVAVSELATQCGADRSEIAVTLTGATADARFTVDCVGQFAYGRWFDATRADVMYFDAYGFDHTLFQGGFDIVRDWSPDGLYLLVERWVEGRCETYRVGLDGSIRRLLEGPTSVANARWSPAGDLIAVQAGPCSGFIDQPIEVVLVDADGLIPVDTIPTTGLDVHPVWSPDGSEVAFVRSHSALYAYAPAARELVEVAQFARAVDFPQWSPDEQHLAVLAFNPQQMIVVTRAGGAVAAVTPDSIIAVGGTAAWFPNGRRLGFIGLRGAIETLYTLTLDDRITRPFSAELSTASAFTVAPGSPVLLVSRPLDRNELLVANADGTGLRRAKVDPQDLVWPLWRAGAVSAAPSVRTVANRAIRTGFDQLPDSSR